MNNFYTYAYLREDGTPYYIGKGRGRRIHSDWTRTVRMPPKERRIYLKKNLTEEEAFKHEKYMIFVFGRKDLGTGILRNMTDGGDGTSGYKHTNETRQLLRKQKLDNPVNHTPEGLERIREFARNIHLNKNLSEKTKNKLSKWRKEYYKKIGGFPEEVKEKQRNTWKKLWKITSPNGEVLEEYTTLREFCEKNNIERSKFRREWAVEELAQDPLRCP